MPPLKIHTRLKHILTTRLSETISIIGTGWLAQRFQRKGLVIAATSIPPIIGTILMLTIPRTEKGVLLFGYYLVSFSPYSSIKYLSYVVQKLNNRSRSLVTLPSHL